MANLLSLLTLAALAAVAVSIAPLHKGDGTAPANDWIVVFYKNSTLEQRSAHMAELKTSLDDASKVTREYSFNAFHAYAATLSAAKLDAVRAADHVVEFVEADQLMKTSMPLKEDVHANVDLHPESHHHGHGKKDACGVQMEATWGLVRTGERELRLDGLFTHDEQAGEGVDAYILDTGIYLEHVEFEGRAIWGLDAVNYPPIQSDGNGHGTHVAGTVMSKKYGVAKKARAIAVAVLSAGGSGSTAGVIEGVAFVCTDHKAKQNRCVANMSLGGGFSLALNRAVEEAIDCGCQFALAAGNENGNACLSSPASEPKGVTVSSSDNNDQRSYFSNYGICSDIYAPGSSITSTWIGSPFAINTISGTSMAAPHACGIMAKLVGDDERLTPAQVKEALSTSSSKDKLTDVQGTPNELIYASCF